MTQVGKICKQIGCPHICYDKTGYCPAHTHLHKPFKKNLESLKIYKTKAWKELRLHILRRNPICKNCRRNPANTVHHIKEARLHPELALEPSNLEALCSTCHNRESQQESMKSRRKFYV